MKRDSLAAKEGKAGGQLYFFCIRGLIGLRWIIYPVLHGVMGQSHGRGGSFQHRVWAGRQWRKFYPLRNPEIVLRSGLSCDFLNLLRTEASMPYYLPPPRQAFQVDQTVLANRAGFPPVIANSNFGSLRFYDVCGVGGQGFDHIDIGIFFAHLGESLFVASPSPSIKKDDQDASHDHGQGGCGYSRPFSMFSSHSHIRDVREGHDKYDRQKLDHREGFLPRLACGSGEHGRSSFQHSLVSVNCE